MGWFDKKSWQLRRKIRDLQSELAVAEREGKYVVEQGLFFAELQEMGDATMMVLGTADHLDSEEEEVIRNFFDRNGFTVEVLRLDRDHRALAAVEIIPPEELTRRVARELKEDGYRLVDDTDQERPPDLDKRMLTLSSIIRATSALFSSHVHQLLVSTPLKMNMEGNRLLHWTPLIREALLRKVPQEVVSLCREPFINGYNHYYGRFGKMANPEQFQNLTDELPGEDLLDIKSDIGLDSDPQVNAEEETEPWSGTTGEIEQATTAAQVSSPVFSSNADAGPPVPGDRAVEAAYIVAKMYKSLIGASGERRVRNAEVLLENFAHFFSAKAACLLSRHAPNAPFRLQANSGKQACVETGRDGKVECDTTFLTEAIASQNVVAVIQDHNGFTNPKAVVVPIEVDKGADTVLYLVEPAAYDASPESNDREHASLLAQVFREFPDLAIPGSTA